jgi:hypothetical protein
VCVRLEGDSPMVEQLRGGVRVCSGLRLRRGTTLVTTAQMSMACFELLSQVVGVVVFCVGCVCLCSRVCSCGSVRFGALCMNAFSSQMI